MGRNKLKIIYYHTISDSFLEYFPKETTQSIDTFKRQIHYLNKRYNIISLEEAIFKFENKENFNNNLVITTDDGFKENYTIISPILNDFNLKFTALLCNNFIDNKSLMWRNVLFYIKNKVSKEEINKVIEQSYSTYELSLPKKEEDIMQWSLRTWPYKLKDELASFFWESLFEESIEDFLNEKKPYLTSSQVNEMLNSGFTIGSHSRSHPYFKDMTNNEIRFETIEAANQLEEKFNTKISSFSFPFERPKGTLDLNNTEKILKSRFKTILGIQDKGLNHKNTSDHWERISMEFNYYFSILNFHLIPVKEKIYKF